MPRKFSEVNLQLALQAKHRDLRLKFAKLDRIYNCSSDIIKRRYRDAQSSHMINLSCRKLTQSKKKTIAKRILELDSRAFSLRLRYVEEMTNILRRVRDAISVDKN